MIPDMIQIFHQMILALSPRIIRILVITDFLVAILIIVCYLLDAQAADADFP